MPDGGNGIDDKTWVCDLLGLLAVGVVLLALIGLCKSLLTGH